MTQLMEKFYEYKKDLHILFIDFKQAYDSIDREQLGIALKNVGVPRKLVKLVEICTAKRACWVRLLKYLNVKPAWEETHYLQ